MTLYSFHYLLNVTRSLDNNRSGAHPHTLEVVTKLCGEGEIHERFNLIERYAGEVIDRYDNKYLNDIEGFEKGVTIEQFGDFLFSVLEKELEKHNFILWRLEIGESPLRTYIISRQI